MRIARSPIKQIRKRLQLTQAQFAAVAGVSSGHMCEVETGWLTDKTQDIVLSKPRPERKIAPSIPPTYHSRQIAVYIPPKWPQIQLYLPPGCARTGLSEGYGHSKSIRSLKERPGSFLSVRNQFINLNPRKQREEPGVNAYQHS